MYANKVDNYFADTDRLVSKQKLANQYYAQSNQN